MNEDSNEYRPEMIMVHVFIWACFWGAFGCAIAAWWVR
jgi:hypothetical protein